MKIFDQSFYFILCIFNTTTFVQNYTIVITVHSESFFLTEIVNDQFLASMQLACYIDKPLFKGFWRRFRTYDSRTVYYSSELGGEKNVSFKINRLR